MSARPWLSFLTGKRCQLNFWAPHQTCSARVSIVLATRSTGRHSVTGRCPAGPATDGSCGFQLSKHPYNKCASKPWRRHLQGCPVRSRTSKGIDQEAPASERQPTRMAVSAATDGAPGEAPEQLRRRVCVIGAGAAGLAAAKELLDEGHSVTVYEADSLVGGVWVISDEIEEDLTGEDRQALELGLGDMSRRLVHSSMYNGLRTNLPRELMTFDGFSFEDAGVSNIDNRRFCSHKAVMSYLAAYADQFSLMQHIHFRTRVISALPLEQEGSQKWIVTTVQSERAPKSGNVHSEEVFDAVVVGNGHYSSPRMPDLDGQRVYEGFQMHSHNYREPSQFMERRVVVLVRLAESTLLCCFISLVRFTGGCRKWRGHKSRDCNLRFQGFPLCTFVAEPGLGSNKTHPDKGRRCSGKKTRNCSVGQKRCDVGRRRSLGGHRLHSILHRIPLPFPVLERRRRSNRGRQSSGAFV
mmetsp:Transcript_7251/g.26673  ORF Transcript_7251/g.26673 Transcript_7251/m.26673 type:complete len:467 (-) Transcript_7251:2331-3731(-)